jgi:hypothetical protein
MAMQPEYYPGLPEDPYMEYLRKLGQFQRSSSDLPYTSLTNLRIENQYPGVRQMPALPDDPVEVINRNSPSPQSNRLGPQFPAAYSESPVPGTAEMMRARNALNQDADSRADAMIAEAQQRRNSAQPSAPRMIRPANPPTNKNSFDFGISAVPQPSTPAQGLLDTEEPADGGSFFDNPMSMGLIQAGLGLLSAPRYSTNPNDVTLSSALARGLGGFIQGYGGTKKRLTEAERQRIEDEYKRSVRDFNQRYMQTQMDATQRRLDNEDETITEKVLRQQEAEKAKQAIIADILTAEPDATATRRSALNRMSLEELNAERAVYFPSAATLQQQEKEKQARERLAELTGQPAEMYEGQSLDKLNAEILKQFKPDKNESEFGNTELGRLLQLAVDSGRMTRDEAIEKGLEMTKSVAAPSLQYMQIDPNDPQAGTQLMMVDRNTGMMQPVPGAIQKPSRKDIPLTDVRLYNQFQLTQNQINQAIGFLSSEDALEGVGPLAGRFRPNWLTSEEGIKLRALIADLTSERLNEKFGAALTENEKAIIKNSVPFESDDEKSLRVKLNTLKELFANKMGLIQQQYPIDRFQRLPNINAVGLQGVEEAYGD